MKIKSISYAGKADVYNMEVDETHDFAVENGIIVHNCYDEWRYLLMRHPIAPRFTTKVIKPYDPLSSNEQQQDDYSWARKLTF